MENQPQDTPNFTSGLITGTLFGIVIATVFVFYLFLPQAFDRGVKHQDFMNSIHAQQIESTVERFKLLCERQVWAEDPACPIVMGETK